MTNLRFIPFIIFVIFFSLCLSATRAQPVHTNQICDIQPTWSHEGRYIAFSSNRSGDFQIYVWDRYTRALHRVSAHMKGNFYPLWSPDSDALAFVSEHVDHNLSRKLFAVTGDSIRNQFPENASRGADQVSWSGRRNLIAYHNVDSTGYYQIYIRRPFNTQKQALTASLGDHLFPRWSPDGSKILYLSIKKGICNLYIMNADGTDPMQITDDPSYELDATWSPDGSKIVYASNRTGNFDIYVTSADGKQRLKLTRDPLFDLSPDWSPDGSKILFLSNRTGNFHIYSMNTDGSEIKPLTNGDESDSYASWSPDGRDIVFVSDRNGIQQIFLMRADGSDQHQPEMVYRDY